MIFLASSRQAARSILPLPVWGISLASMTCLGRRYLGRLARATVDTSHDSCAESLMIAFMCGVTRGGDTVSHDLGAISKTTASPNRGSGAAVMA